eukprot:COSAG02_NODE_195_length_29750_cov_79.793329_27_plen_78_part_00
MTFALLIGNLARFWKSLTYNLNLSWTVGWGGASGGAVPWQIPPYNFVFSTYKNGILYRIVYEIVKGTVRIVKAEGAL